MLAALARGERLDMATTLSAGVVDELVALHEDLGVLPALGEALTTRTRTGAPDALLLRTLATLHFVAGASLSGATETLFKEPAILPRLGWAPLPRCLVSTRPWADGLAALQAYRPRWHSEDNTYRELKEGWGLEEQRWGRDSAAARGRPRALLSPNV